MASEPRHSNSPVVLFELKRLTVRVVEFVPRYSTVRVVVSELTHWSDCGVVFAPKRWTGLEMMSEQKR